MSHPLEVLALAPVLSRLVSSGVAWSFSNAGSLPSKLLQSAVSIALISGVLAFGLEYLRKHRGYKSTKRWSLIAEVCVFTAAVLRGVDEYTIHACGGRLAWWKETFISDVMALASLLSIFEILFRFGPAGIPPPEEVRRGA